MKMSDTGVPIRIFDIEILNGYKEIDLPEDKMIIENKRTGKPFLKSKPKKNEKNENKGKPGSDLIFCYWE